MLKRLLIDADTGIDDSIAILFALKRPDVRVMGITTGFGNTTARQAAENSLDVYKRQSPLRTARSTWTAWPPCRADPARVPQIKI